MYDTLMQMGRWFGYRPGYLDLCRLYTTPELSQWFAHIAHATEELRGEFDLMAASRQTPKEFGLRIQSHPEMMVTSSVKMRHGVKRQVSFQGSSIETLNFWTDEVRVKANWEAGEKFIEAIKKGAGSRVERKGNNSYMWRDVPAELVVNFLQQYQEHDAAVKARTRELKEYVEKEAGRERLVNWSVLIARGRGDLGNFGNEEVKLVEREPFYSRNREINKDELKNIKDELEGDMHFRIKRIISPSDELADLSEVQVDKALERDKEAWRLAPLKRNPPTKPPQGRFIRQERDARNGHLILYPLVSTEGRREGVPPFLAFAISFPAVAEDSATKITYVVNNVYEQED